MDKDEITPEMVSEGIGILIDYGMGGMSAGEAVTEIFLAMMAAAPAPSTGLLSTAREPQGSQLQLQVPRDHQA